MLERRGGILSAQGGGSRRWQTLHSETCCVRPQGTDRDLVLANRRQRKAVGVSVVPKCYQGSALCDPRGPRKSGVWELCDLQQSELTGFEFFESAASCLVY